MGGCSIGLDAGSTTVKVVVLDEVGASRARWVARHHGRPAEVSRDLLALAREAVDGPVLPLGVTGSAGTALAEALGGLAVHETVAVAKAVRTRAPGARTVVELGGQDAKILWLDPRGETVEMNDRCAAGTGATLDRVARRLGLGADTLASLRLEGDARVAAKCGVFAETDVVNLVQAGARPGVAFAALARAIVVQNLAVLARGCVVPPPVVLAGGPHAHLPILVEAWREALADLWGRRDVEPGEVAAIDDAILLGAIGAALHVAGSGRALVSVRGVLGAQRIGPPIVEDADERAERERAMMPRLSSRRGGSAAQSAELWVGLDAGSTSTKAVALDAHGSPVRTSYGLSSGDPVRDARERLDEVLAGARPRLGGLAVTGYGAALVELALGADLRVLETRAHAVAAEAIAPGVEVVVDVGGTDVKVLRLSGGEVASLQLSSQCTAGIGGFLGTMAAELGVPMSDFAELALTARRSPAFTVGCGVFLDTDRVTFQRDGFAVPEILAGLAHAVPRNVWELIVGEAPGRLGRSFLLTGGAHKNRAVALAHEGYLRARAPGAAVTLHPSPELAGALGAALTLRSASSTRGVARSAAFARLSEGARVALTVSSGRELVCDRCEIHCARSVVKLDSLGAGSRTLVLGHGCERGAELGSTARRTRAHAPDLLAEEARRLFAQTIPDPPRREARRTLPVIGIPRVMALYRCAPFLLHYLRAAGLPPSHLVLSPWTSHELFSSGARWAANDPCFPAKLVPAHVDWLLRRGAEGAAPLDLVLMPAFTHAAIAVTGARETASCPIVAGCGHAAVASLGRDGDRFAAAGAKALTPTLTMTDLPRLEAQLLGAFGTLLALDPSANRAAMEHGLRAQRGHQERLRARGRAVLARARREGRPVAVVLARPYHADPGVQHGVSTALARRGIPVLGVSSLPPEGRALDVSDLAPELTNSGCAERVWAARVVREDPSLFAIELSSFRCGQDASVAGLLDDLLGDGKPALRLHDLDEDRPGLSLSLRVEAFIETITRRAAHARRSVDEERTAIP